MTVDTATLQQTIEKAKQELEQMIDLQPQIMLLMDASGHVSRANRACLNLLGITDFRAVLGKRLPDLFACCDTAALANLFSTEARSGTAESLVTLADGRNRRLRFTGVGEGRGRNVSVVMIRDVTEEDQERMLLEKEHKKTAVQVLMGALMHTINQPLTVIMAKAHLMHVGLQQGLTERQDMINSLQHIMQLTMQIAELMERMERPQDFVTEEYLPNVDILDLERSASPQRTESVANVTLGSLITMLDQKELGAAGHSLRVGHYSRFLAQKYGLSAEQVERAGHCGAFHDIGKTGISTEILKKTTSLSESEMTLIRTHPEVGFNLMLCFTSSMDDALVIRSHHERIDGHGYPAGLTGDKIPIEARIISVADAFDALRGCRSYQGPVSLDQTIQEIRLGAGTQFDAKVVDVFESCVKELDALYPAAV